MILHILRRASSTSLPLLRSLWFREASDSTRREHGSFIDVSCGPCSHTGSQVATTTGRIHIDLLRFYRRCYNTHLCLFALATPSASPTRVTEHQVWKNSLDMVNTFEEESVWQQDTWHRCVARASSLGNRILRCQYWSVGLGHRLASLHNFR